MFSISSAYVIGYIFFWCNYNVCVSTKGILTFHYFDFKCNSDHKFGNSVYIHITSRKLKRPNYLLWTKAMMVYIETKGKLKHPIEDPPPYKVLMSSNKMIMIITWLSNNMKPYVSVNFMFLETVKQIWVVKETYFQEKIFQEFINCMKIFLGQRIMRNLWVSTSIACIP